MRQAFAGMLWCKQFYHYDVEPLARRRSRPARRRPSGRKHGRNASWRHLNNHDVISMPDPWEYPWFAAWDLAFHCVALAHVDPEFAKEQLLLLCREWYMHPNGQLPAYEWAFGDVNPPVHAWAALRVFEIDGVARPRVPRADLPEAAAQLHVVGEPEGRRRATTCSRAGSSAWTTSGPSTARRRCPWPAVLEQSDGTAWMAMYCLNLLEIAAGPGRARPVVRGHGDEVLRALRLHRHGRCTTRACGTRRTASTTTCCVCAERRAHAAAGPLDGRADPAVRARPPSAGRPSSGCPTFAARFAWFAGEQAASSPRSWATSTRSGADEGRLLSIVRPRAAAQHPADDARRGGVPVPVRRPRRVSRVHRDHPFELRLDGHVHRVDYEPGESTTGLFGGNSNWRGPVWFPVNYLLIEALRRYHRYFGDDFTVECPTGSGRQAPLLARWPTSWPAAGRAVPRRRERPAAGVRRRTSASRPTRRWHDRDAVPRVLPRRHRAPASAPRTRPAGPAWSPTSSFG